ncbi:hypothetical protein [Plasticicumulans acidivorans]|uniref:Uncharacterized protein n=1 Tax=Plasticicumulans acidivorans TaxID=886464 RepID=A0A317MVA8_9GAMM|nr:hypothetical protein [Plasticicumulans acidivorans]PWV61635.1 hypothetical protein C7443_10563 [Plasticicumulans acidivorans]
MSKKLKRTLALKAVAYASINLDFKAKPIDVVVRDIFRLCPLVADRHYPPPNSISSNGFDDEFFYFINDMWEFDVFGNYAVIFEFCTYQPGHIPAQITAELQHERLKINMSELGGGDGGANREVVNVMRILAYGDVCVVESIRGCGGMAAVEKLLNFIMGKIEEKKYPKLYFSDFISHDLKAAIKRGGGAAGFSMKASNAIGQDMKKFRKLLGEANDNIRGASNVVVSWKGSKLNENDIVEAVEEFKTDEDLESIQIVLNNGNVINGIEKFKYKKQVDIPSTKGKHPNRDRLMQEMCLYLLELQAVDESGYRVLNDQGFINRVSSE